MYCTNCGKEINENQGFCDNCGAKNIVRAERTSNNINGSLENVSQILKKSKLINNFRVENNINKKKFYIIAVIFFIISGLMHFTKTVEIGMLGFAVGQNIFTLLESGILTGIFVILYVVSFFLTIKPFLYKDDAKMVNIVPMIISSGATLILIICVMIYAYNKGGGYGAETVFTFTGWMQILSVIGNILVSTRLILEIRKNYKNEWIKMQTFYYESLKEESNNFYNIEETE